MDTKVTTVSAWNTGFTGLDGDVCSPCAAGTYKIGGGSVTCSNCGAGTYSTTSGATSKATCVTCPVSSNSLTLSTTSAAGDVCSP